MSSLLLKLSLVLLFVSFLSFLTAQRNEVAFIGGLLASTGKHWAGQRTYWDYSTYYGVSGYIQHANPNLQYPSLNTVSYWISVGYPDGSQWAQIGVIKGRDPYGQTVSQPEIYTEYKYVTPNCGTFYNFTRWGAPGAANNEYRVYRDHTYIDGCGNTADHFLFGEDGNYRGGASMLQRSGGYRPNAYLEVTIVSGPNDHEQAGTAYWGTNNGTPTTTHGLKLYNSSGQTSLWSSSIPTEVGRIPSTDNPYQVQSLAQYYSFKAWGP